MSRGVQWRTRAAFQLGPGHRWTWIAWSHEHGSKHAAIFEKADELRAVAWDYGNADHGEADRVNF